MKANDLEIYNREAHQWWAEDGIFRTLDHLNPPRFLFFDRFIADWSGQRVLDVGCGGGFTCEALAQRGAHVSGIDLSEPSIQAAQAHAQAQGLAIDYRSGRSEALPFDNAQFDAVVCVDVLEHVDDLEKSVAEIQRVLKPGGWFLFDTINRTFKSRLVMIWLLERILKKIPRGVHDWNKFIKPKEMEALLQRQQFTNITFQGMDVRGEERATKRLRVVLNDNLSVMYAGAAQCAEH